jgi:predicted RNase H-like HicB family nuclease
MAAYHINVFWSPEDDAWIADVPDLPGCSAFGDTPEEAVRELKIAQELWLEAAGAHGRDIPPPQYWPASYAI